MSQAVVQVLAAVAFAGFAALLARRLRLGLEREIVWAAARALLQLAVVGALIAAIFRVPALAVLFVAAMVLAAALTSGGRLRAVAGSRRHAAVAIGVPALSATGLLLLVGAFDTTPRAIIPTVGILIGGAMAATTLTGRRLLEGLREQFDAVETRLSLGDDVRTAVRPVVRGAMVTGLVPAIDQTRSVGLVTLPGTFVGLVLGGASPATAARTQLVVLLALLAVELLAALLISTAIVARLTAPGERVVLPDPAPDETGDRRPWPFPWRRRGGPSG
ncbi:ABC transporter permease [Patulibacter minatonensis]|uniref:ABC transporter permease n=1 Tax=Patulibacter minatonensis TaxID=298163 RepID=UPI0006888250|nr:ABC transporter permease [Patulibacter minatonensis]